MRFCITCSRWSRFPSSPCSASHGTFVVGPLNAIEGDEGNEEESVLDMRAVLFPCALKNLASCHVDQETFHCAASYWYLNWMLSFRYLLFRASAVCHCQRAGSPHNIRTSENPHTLRTYEIIVCFGPAWRPTSRSFFLFSTAPGLHTTHNETTTIKATGRQRQGQKEYLRDTMTEGTDGKQPLQNGKEAYLAIGKRFSSVLRKEDPPYTLGVLAARRKHKGALGL